MVVAEEGDAKMKTTVEADDAETETLKKMPEWLMEVKRNKMGAPGLHDISPKYVFFFHSGKEREREY